MTFLAKKTIDNQRVMKQETHLEYCLI